MQDLQSGFLVFLIALPLCLGISMASGAPPTAGIITAIVGGLIVSRFNGSYLTINGPAAGLIVVVLSASQSLGNGDLAAGFKYTLAVIAVASLFQIILGLSNAGRLNSFFPNSVIHGMLAAIGFIIFAKQIHVLLGVKVAGNSILATIAEIPKSFVNANVEIALIGVTSLAILIFWATTKVKFLKAIPGPLVVVLVGMALAKYFDLDHEHIYLIPNDFPFFSHHEFTVGPKFLVSIPKNLSESFYAPDFSKIGTMEFWMAVVSICLVGSLETMISAMAVDKLDPQKRVSNLNKDLTAVGVGNFICSMIGGLPMIAEIVRSSANINNGAKTSWSNFFHGAFLLVFIVFFPFIIQEIPLSALAAILVFTGYRLASPKEFAKTLELGREQLTIFVVTMVGCIVTDLLVGVLLGIATKLVIHAMRGVSPRALFQLDHTLDFDEGESTYNIKFDSSVVFSNMIPLKEKLDSIPSGKIIKINLGEAHLVDHTVMEYLTHFREEYNFNGGRCEFIGLDFHRPVSNHKLAARRLVYSEGSETMFIETESTDSRTQ